jgi:hypothetical protein
MASANVPDSFYVTLFNNASKNVYTDNAIAAFRVRLAKLVQLVSADSCEVGICEFPYLPPLAVKHVAIVVETTGLISCKLIKPQNIVGTITRYLRTFIYPSTYCLHNFDNLYYIPVEKGTFKDIRIKILTMDKRSIKIKDRKSPSKDVLHFRHVSTDL